MPGYSIHSAYEREHRRNARVIVGFIAGDRCSFIRDDAHFAAPILQHPIERVNGYDECSFHMGAFAATRDQLMHSGRPLVFL